jgi:hypothetical protein
VGLFEGDAELNAVKLGKGPTELLEMMSILDVAKQAGFEGLELMPGHMKFIPGVAAGGKSFSRYQAAATDYRHPSEREGTMAPSDSDAQRGG